MARKWSQKSQRWGVIVVFAAVGVGAVAAAEHHRPAAEVDSRDTIEQPSAAVCDSQLGQETGMDKVRKTDEEWRRQLTPEQYRVMRQQGTEQAFTGAYYNNHEKGMYRCMACGAELYSSETKFDSGTGWPSFWAPVKPTGVRLEQDDSHGMRRTEVLCARCDAHLGHVFDDGPQPTGQRHCINSSALQFVKPEE